MEYSCNDTTETFSDCNRRLGNSQEVSEGRGSSPHPPSFRPIILLVLTYLVVYRGSKFLKQWMEFLEENADLRYPDVASLAQE